MYYIRIFLSGFLCEHLLMLREHTQIIRMTCCCWWTDHISVPYWLLPWLGKSRNKFAAVSVCQSQDIWPQKQRLGTWSQTCSSRMFWTWFQLPWLISACSHLLVEAWRQISQVSHMPSLQKILSAAKVLHLLWRPQIGRDWSFVSFCPHTLSLPKTPWRREFDFDEHTSSASTADNTSSDLTTNNLARWKK